MPLASMRTRTPTRVRRGLVLSLPVSSVGPVSGALPPSSSSLSPSSSNSPSLPNLPLRRVLFLVCALFLTCTLTLLLPALVTATMATFRPLTWIDNGSVATDEAYGADTDGITYANVTAGDGNLTYLQFTGATGTPAVLAVNLTYDHATGAFVDDEWSVVGSRDGGFSWDVYASWSTANVGQQVLTQQLSPPGATWSLDEVQQNVSARFLVRTSGAADGGWLALYGVWLTVLLDDEGPGISGLAPADGFSTDAATVEFSFTPDDELSGITNCSLVLDGFVNATNASVAEGVNTTFSVLLTEGLHSWSVRCADDASPPQMSESAARAVTVDRSAPNVSLLSPGNATSYADGLPIPLVFSFDDLSENAVCVLRIDSAVNATKAPAWEGVSETFYLWAENGAYTWQVNCTDPFGYAGISPPWTLDVANGAPPSVGEIFVGNISPSLPGPVNVDCNATVSDTTSAEIATAGGMLYREGFAGSASPSVAAYNGSCSLQPNNATSRLAVCRFALPAYARAGPWRCRINATDSGGLVGFSEASTTVEPFYAIDITPPYLSFGDYQPGQISSDRVLAIGNLGNVGIDIALDGYGSVDGDGLAMTCGLGSIPLANERYALSADTPFASMTPLTDSPVVLPSFDLAPGNDSVSSRNLYWKVQLPSPLNGTCSGFLTVTAVPD